MNYVLDGIAFALFLAGITGVAWFALKQLGDRDK